MNDILFMMVVPVIAACLLLVTKSDKASYIPKVSETQVSAHE